MNCKICNEPVLNGGDGYCKKHYIETKESEYLDNTDLNNLGIVKWARDMLPQYMPQETPLFHIQIYLLLLMLYVPFLRNKMERLLNLVSFRGSGKSTLCTMIFPAYILVHNGKKIKLSVAGKIIETKIEEKFICIISETGEMAEDFAVRIRDEFLTNKAFKFFYKYTIEDAIDDRTGQLTRRAFKFNGCYLLAVGTKMQIRGRIKGAFRVTLLIADDIYSEKSVKTEPSRIGIRNWWNAAVMNSVDDILGKVAFLGTILHEDTVNMDMIRNDLWKTIYIKLMPLDLFEEFLSKYMDIDQSSGECKLPFSDVKNEEERIQKRREHYENIYSLQDWQLAWPSRIDLYLVALKVADAVRNRKLSLFYQEMFHEIVPTSNKRFKPEFFQKLPEYNLIKQDGEVWFYCTAMYKNPVPINIYIGVDTGTGTLDGDDSSVAVIGVLPDNRWILFRTVYGKFGSRDETRLNTADDLRYGKVITDRRYILKIGYIDEAIRLALEFQAKEIKVGYAGSEKELVNTTRSIAMMNGLSAMVNGRKQLSGEGSKVERIVNTLHSHYSTYSVWHGKGNGKAEHELEYLGSSKEDNVADSIEVAASGVTAPQFEIFIESNAPYEDRDPNLEEARMNAMDFFEDLGRSKN